MANTLERRVLSETADGDGIRVSTAAPIDGSDTLIHTAPSGTSDLDFPTLYAYNKHTSAVLLHIKWGDSTDAIIVSIPSQAGLVLVAPGDIPICDSNTITVSAGTVDVVTIYGSVVHKEVP